LKRGTSANIPTPFVILERDTWLVRLDPVPMTSALLWIPDQVRDDDGGEVALVSLLDPLCPQEQPIWVVYPQRRHLLPKVRLLIDKLREELPGALRRSESL